MPATVVRLDNSDLAQMAMRARSMLTTEGAQAWYSNDIPRLLEEIVALRQEYVTARESFTRQIVGKVPANASLDELSELWKAEATGLYEKAQYKKLRDQLAAIKAERDEALAAALQAQQNERDTANMLAAAQLHLTEAQESFQNERRDKTDKLQRAEQRNAELEMRIRELDVECKRLSGMVERNTQMLSAQCNERITAIKELLSKAQEL